MGHVLIRSEKHFPVVVAKYLARHKMKTYKDQIKSVKKSFHRVYNKLTKELCEQLKKNGEFLMYYNDF